MMAKNSIFFKYITCITGLIPVKIWLVQKMLPNGGENLNFDRL